jgi:hypothetical protein
LAPKAAGLALLRAANNAFFRDKEKSLGTHPFDSPEGAERLESYLKLEDPGYSQDFHAAMGLGFVSAEIRNRLLKLALEHPNKSTQLEAAWADALHAGKTGIEFLTKACLDVKTSETAKQYLEEVNQAAAIPEAAREPKFAAKAAMTSWLMHPKELGEAPKELELIDQRELFWPPVKEKRLVSLFKFTWESSEPPAKEGAKPKTTLKTSYGMTGSGMTWSFFKEYPKKPEIGSLYLDHCTLEMNRKPQLKQEVAFDPKLRKPALEALQKENPDAEIFKKLKP